ncbi:MAG TPA: ATP-binding protein [Phycisphaerae bacterium]|nr:FHA domain-containing protein [Phycisphaerae bacterium]HOB74095.1 ATP-binding protein [Phycisphaerae bacterium]HOJ56756.1 ATP-binding protein [Phycisphaerae bacterium]HOL25379.1 ATP-binding protein [Phycisphaerae bacterium]HPP22055.1 ATP-binding protein [Phycisphaerae bacterium]
MAILHVLQGPDKGRTFRTMNESAILGRESEQIPLTDRTISRQHAQISPDNGAWILKDLNSANGTYINGVRVRGPVRLKHGDQIKMGSTLIVYTGDQSVEKLSGSSIPRDMIDLDAASPSLDSAILASSNPEDSVIIAQPELTEAARAWKVMSEITAAIGAIIDPEQLLERVMDVILEEMPVDRGFILMYDRRGEELIPQVVRYRRGVRAKKQKITTSRRIIQHVLDHKSAVLCTNAADDKRFRQDAGQDSITDFGLHSVICAPIMDKDLLLGVIHIDSAAATHTYTQEQLRLMGAIGQMTGMAIQNARLVQQQMQMARLAATGETVAYLSHHIKNVLQGIQSGGDLVSLGLRNQKLDTIKQGWEIVERNLERILRLSTNMLAFSKAREPRLVQSYLNKIVADAVQLAQKRADEKNVVLLSDFEETIPPMPLDPEGIHQATLNIIGNAIDAVAPKTGTVHVSTLFDAEQGIADIVVSDNGPGIEHEKIEEIFEPFKSSKGQAGTGLGLAVARKVIREHHGRIVVESRPGEGTTFRLRLPVQELSRASEETYSTLQ